MSGAPHRDPLGRERVDVGGKRRGEALLVLAEIGDVQASAPTDHGRQDVVVANFITLEYVEAVEL